MMKFAFNQARVTWTGAENCKFLEAVKMISNSNRDWTRFAAHVGTKVFAAFWSKSRFSILSAVEMWRVSNAIDGT